MRTAETRMDGPDTGIWRPSAKSVLLNRAHARQEDPSCLSADKGPGRERLDEASARALNSMNMSEESSSVRKLDDTQAAAFDTAYAEGGRWDAVKRRREKPGCVALSGS